MGFQLQEKRMRAASNNLPGWSRARASQTTGTKCNMNLPTTWYPGKNTADAQGAIPPDMESRSIPPYPPSHPHRGAQSPSWIGAGNERVTLG